MARALRVNHTDAMPCNIHVGGNDYNVYVKGLSSVHLENKDIWRAQLPCNDKFKVMKASSIQFIFLGYDAENKVYATWNPYIVKQRLNEAKYVSFYSRLSAQKESRQKQSIVRRTLNHNTEVVVLQEEKLCEYITKWNEFFKDTGKYVPIGSKRLKREAKGKNLSVSSDNQAQYENGKIYKIIEPELLCKIEPFLNCEYPKPLPAVKVVQQFYSGIYKLDMEFKDWMNLVTNIEWDKIKQQPE